MNNNLINFLQSKPKNIYLKHITGVLNRFLPLVFLGALIMDILHKYKNGELANEFNHPIAFTFFYFSGFFLIALVFIYLHKNKSLIDSFYITAMMLLTLILIFIFEFLLLICILFFNFKGITIGY